jgi:hypothetical protein
MHIKGGHGKVEFSGIENMGLGLQQVVLSSIVFNSRWVTERKKGLLKLQ